MTNKRGAGVSPAGDGIARISNGGQDVRATKEFEDDDPMELQAVFFPAGNAEEQARCFIEEFAMMGMTPQEISKLFSDPFYSGTHRLAEIVGMIKIMELIQTGCPRNAGGQGRPPHKQEF